MSTFLTTSHSPPSRCSSAELGRLGLVSKYRTVTSGWLKVNQPEVKDCGFGDVSVTSNNCQYLNLTTKRITSDIVTTSRQCIVENKWNMLCDSLEDNLLIHSESKFKVKGQVQHWVLNSSWRTQDTKDTVQPHRLTGKLLLRRRRHFINPTRGNSN